MRDDLGDRMKEQYENRTRYFLPRRTYSIIRLDGKAFHQYTKNLSRPFDAQFIEDFNQAALEVIGEIQGAVFGYLQSDEFSILLTDFAQINTNSWFDGNIQKISSISASLMTAEFNRFRARRWKKEKEYIKTNEFISAHGMEEEAADNFDYENISADNKFKTALFDSRVFTIPDRTEVMNYFIFRNQDCARNSISMVAQSLFSHKELQNKNSAEMQEMIFSKGINWAEYDESLKNGRLIIRETYRIERGNFDFQDGGFHEDIERSRWVVKPAWKFTQDKDKLLNMVPNYT